MLTKFEHTGHMGRFDRQCKLLQQHLLHSLRVQAKVLAVLGRVAGPVADAEAHATNAQHAQTLLTEHWAFTAAQVAKLDVERKEAVLPG